MTCTPLWKNQYLTGSLNFCEHSFDRVWVEWINDYVFLLDNEIVVLGTVYSLFVRPISGEVAVRKGKEKSYLMAIGDWRL